MTIGDRIKQARKLRGLTQIELSEKCGWEHQSRISSYERDEREPGRTDIESIAGALDVRAAWLFFGEGEMTETQAVPRELQSLYRLIVGLDDSGRRKAENLVRLAFDRQETERDKP